MTKVLITGGAGFIGSNAVSHFVAKGYEVHVVDKITYAADVTRLPQNVPIYTVDIASSYMHEVILEVCPDVIINFAASSHVDRSIQEGNLSEFIESNTTGVANLVKCLRYTQKNKGKDIFLVHISTDEVFGDLAFGDTSDGFSEYNLLEPNNPYSATKASGELMLEAMWKTYQDFNYAICRATNNYGPNQHWEKFIPTVVLSILDRKPIPIYGQGKNVREWLFVDDFVRGIEQVIVKRPKDKHFHFGSGVRLANLDVVYHILCLLNASRDLISFVPDRLGHDRQYALSCDYTKHILEWSPTVDFVGGLEITINDIVEKQKRG